MQTIDVHDAETHLTALVQAAARGESFLIAIDGNVVVEVRAIEGRVHLSPNIIDRGETNRTLGSLQGQAVLPEDFDRYMEDEILEMFGLQK